jgi:SAM-dependent methyltransferase
VSDWTAGYVADLGYTYGYYPELNPLRIRLAFLNQGLLFPDVGSACELGFGQGVSTNLHACASITQWYGTDFNPAQAGFAQDLATASRSGAQLYDDDFAEFANRPDLPDFDFIALHGIWSWVSEDNRKKIVDFVRRKLKVGGVLYISYNTLPGWSDFLSIRHIMFEHASMLGSQGEATINRVNNAMAFANKVVSVDPLLLQAAPKVKEQLLRMQSHDRHYIAHEYFNRDWQPMHFSEVAQLLASAKLQFACSASYLDAIDPMHITPEQKQVLDNIPDQVLREGVRDVMLNRRFRKDYWVKGARRLSAVKRIEMLRKQRVVLTKAVADVPIHIMTHKGEAQLNEALYRPLLDLMADHVPRSLGEMETALQHKGIQGGQLLIATMTLTEFGNLTPVQDDEQVSQVEDACQRINAQLMANACEDADVQFLVSPLTGGGVPVSRINQLFLLAVSEGHPLPKAWAQRAWEVLSSHGQSLVKDGKTLQSSEANLAELLAQAQSFVDKQKPLLKALRVWPEPAARQHQTAS